MTADKEVWLLLDSSGPGGIETHVRLLAKGLRKRGLAARVVFLKRHGDHPIYRQLEDDDTPYLNLDGRLGSVLRFLRRSAPAVLHTHGYKAGILGRFSAQLLGIPVVHTYHSGEPGRGRVPLWQAIDRWSGFANTRRYAVSHPVAAELPWSSRLLANFVEVPSQPCRRDTPRRVTFLGRISPEKGPDLFCRIAAACGEDIAFDVYGDGPMRLELEQTFGSRVNFHGYTDRIATVLQSTGLLLMPSRYEGLPLAALEAMAAGVPVAAASVGGLPELIEHGSNGFLFEPGAVEEAAHIVRRWIALPQTSQQRLSENAYSYVQRKHSLTSAAHTLESEYRSICTIPVRELSVSGR